MKLPHTWKGGGGVIKKSFHGMGGGGMQKQLDGVGSKNVKHISLCYS